MTKDIILSVSYVDFFPCYKPHNASLLLITTRSTACILLFMFLGSVSVLIVCGNLVVIVSIVYFKQLHSSTNSFLLSLAMADLLVGVIVFPLSMKSSMTFCLYYKGIICAIRENFDVILSTSSILNLCCISIDRYYAVCQPLTYRTKMSVHVVAIMIVAVWVVSVIVAIGIFIGGLYQQNCKGNCLNSFLLTNSFGLIFSFYLPLIILLYIYLKIFLVAQRQARSIQSTKSGATVSKMETKATKTLAVVMGVFLICWSPFFLCFTFQLLYHVSVPAIVTEALLWLALCNSMFNPFIYAFFYSWFRSAFRIIISGKIFQGDFSNSRLL